MRSLWLRRKVTTLSFKTSIVGSFTGYLRVLRAVCIVSVLTSSLGLAEETSTKPTDSPLTAESLTPGDHTRHLMVGNQKRFYIVHVPPGYDSNTPTPVVLALHGAGMNGSMMVWFTGLNKTADAKGFIAVYPSGTGTGPLLTWNAGGLIGRLKKGRTDDVVFIGRLLDELEATSNVDRNRVYACGMSNGGMMCYRLAAEMSDRIAAIAAVAGTMAMDVDESRRPVPVMHFHGTKDEIVPYGAPIRQTPAFLQLKGVEETIETWVKLNGCDEKPLSDTLSKVGDKRTVTRRTYANGNKGSEVVLIVIEGGGHTWPGRQLPVGFLGKCARNISANELIWEFFEKHPLDQTIDEK